MHTECPKSPSEILRSMPTDDDIDLLYELHATHPSSDRDPAEWGDGLTWSEFHHETKYPYLVVYLQTHFLSYKPKMQGYRQKSVSDLAVTAQFSGRKRAR